MARFKAPRGTVDILPQDAGLYRYIEETSRRIFKLYNYHQISTPIFEDVGVFIRGVGEITDIVEKQLLYVKQKDEPGVRYCLRPEGTSPVIRAYLEHNFKEKKLFYIGPMFRGERPQKGRLRQFLHIGAEYVDSYSFYCDLEIIEIVFRIADSLGIKGYKLVINSLGCKDDKRRLKDLLRDKLVPFREELCPSCRQRLSKNVLRVLDCKNPSCRRIVGNIGLKIQDYLCRDCLNHYQLLKEALRKRKLGFKEDPFLVRGLDYYTQTVFEFKHSSLGSQDAFAAGGRYNNLSQELGGRPLGCVGFALGVERTLLLLKHKSSTFSDLGVFIAVQNNNFLSQAVELLSILRREGICSDMDYSPLSLKSQMRRANLQGARFCIILGEEEIRRKRVSVKDMRKNLQVSLDRKELVGFLKENLYVKNS